MKKIHTAAAILICALSAAAMTETRSLNDGWAFSFPCGTPQVVNLPHTFNSDAYRVKNYYRGPVAYAKTIDISPEKGKRYILKFDAASSEATVRVNGVEAGRHQGGYSPFAADITPLLRHGSNTITATVDNSNPDIPPTSADFTFWGGLTRGVSLMVKDDTHFAEPSGVRVKTPSVNPRSATVKIDATVVNSSDSDVNRTVRATIFAPDGEALYGACSTCTIAPHSSETISLPEIIMEDQLLWSPDAPNLYRVETILTDRDDNILDSATSPLGFRFYSFDGEKGFSLNGRHLKLRGVNRHQDMEPFGFAVPDSVHRLDMHLIKELGANFVRLAHYQQSDEVLALCDTLGLMVWEEIPVVNAVPPSPVFADNAAQSLAEMIDGHISHPSVILWGYMNEILLKVPENDKACEARTLRLATRLDSIAHRHDPTRPTVMAFHGSDRYNKASLALTDIIGLNLYQGWYGSNLADFDAFMRRQHSLYPARPLIVSEWGAGSDRRLHSLHPAPFDFSTEYQQTYVEHYLPFIENNDFVSGGAYWNLIDFNVAAREESMPRVNNKGLFYNNRRPKDAAYYFKAMWRDDIPVVHIASRDFTTRPQGRDIIKVYANTPEVSLTVDGGDTLTASTANRMAVFTPALTQGRHIIRASGTLADGSPATDSLVITVIPAPDLLSGDVLAINLGSDCDYIPSDVNRGIMLADKPYSEGSYGWLTGDRLSTTGEIKGTEDGPVYQSQLSAGRNFYRIDAPAGEYEVTMFLADIQGPVEQQAYLLGRDKANAAHTVSTSTPPFSATTRVMKVSNADGRIILSSDTPVAAIAVKRI